MGGVFISFEGVDGSGKSTHAKLLHAALLARGYDAVLTREPGGAPVAEAVRALLLDPVNAMEPETEALLMAAARAEHVRKTLLPALERGAVVVCERYLDSSMAYQAYGRGLGVEAVRRANDLATGGLIPDLTFLMVAPKDETDARVARRDPDRIEGEGADFRERVERGFLALAQAEPNRFAVMECTDTKAAVAERVWARAASVLERGGT